MANINAYDALPLVVGLRRQGVVLFAEGDELVCQGSENILTSEVMDRLRAQKDAILALLGQEAAAGDLPVLRPDPAHRFEPFPLNENQQAYWIGRDASMAFGRVGIHVFFELEAHRFSKSRFENAWNALLERHDMLRARVLPDGTQQVAERVPPFSLTVTSLRGLEPDECESRLARAAEELSHSCYTLERWPQNAFHAFELSKERTVLMGSIDCWCLDGHSLQIVMSELAALYEGKMLPPAPECSFRDHVLAGIRFRESARYRNSLDYWQRKIADLPPAPVLPLASSGNARSNASAPVFKRHEARLDAATFSTLSARLRKLDLTLSAFLLACYGETLGHWTYGSRFTINVPRVNRPLMHRDTERCVGEFASFSLVAMDLADNNATFLQRCKSVQRQVWKDLEHDLVSGVTVLRAWRQHCGVGPETGMPYVFTSEPESGGTGGESSWMASLERLGTVRKALTQTPQVWMDAQFGRIGDELHLSWDVLDDLFPEGLPDDMFATYVRLVETMSREDAPWHETSPLHGTVGAHCAYSVEEGPVRPVPTVDCLDILASRASRWPDLVAVTDARGSLTWRDVYALVAALCERLRKAGLTPGARVALPLAKGRWQAIATYAVLAAGGVVVPLDCDAPDERLRSLVHDCGSSLILTDFREVDRNTLWDVPALSLVSPTAIMPSPLPVEQTIGDELFAVIYTSGSTGTPKGVMMPHGGVVNAVMNFADMHPLGQDTPALALSPFHHDMAMPDYMGCLLLGMPLVFPEHARRKDPEHWLELVREHKVGFWNSVPAMMTMLMDFMAANPDSGTLESLRLVTLGGDWLPVATVSALLERAPQAAVYGIGGPTEISLANICHRVTEIDPAWTHVPYGKPFANAGYQVRNEAGQLCPRGVAGELCCTGPYMSPGYLGDAQRTRTAFTISERGERMYHTGDMGRMKADGTIEFLGRKDNQLKIHGFRIEPSEIECVLRGHPDVHDAVVLAPKGKTGERQLRAWLQPEPGARVDARDVRDFAAKRLPSYMVPALVGVRNTFPLTANGKLDRLAMAEWEMTAMNEVYTAKTATENLVCAAWKNILGTEPSSGQSNFFEDGGDSLSAIRFLNELRAAGLERLSVMDIFRHPTPVHLAGLVDQRAGERSGDVLPPVRPTPRRFPSPSNASAFVAPATHAQTRLWIEERSRSVDPHLLSFVFKVTGSVDGDTIERALNRVVCKHEALRTTLHADAHDRTCDGDGAEEFRVVQHIHAYLPIHLRVLRAEGGNGGDVASFVRGMTEEPFTLDEGPLVRAALVLRSDNEAELRLVFHHAIFDGWSMRVFQDSLREALQSDGMRSEGMPSDGMHSAGVTDGKNPEGCCAAPAVECADLACWEQSAPVRAEMSKRLRELVRSLKDARPPRLPDFSLLEAHDDNAETADATLYLEQSLTRECADGIGALAKASGVTPFMVGLAAFSLLVNRMSGEENLLLGTYAALRDRPELENVVGLMVNPVPLIVPVGKAATVGELLALVRTAVMEAADNALVPFDILVGETRPERRAGEHPLFDCVFSQDNTEATEIAGSGMRMALVPGGRHSTAMQLDVAMRGGEHPALEATARAPQWTMRALRAFMTRLLFVLRQFGSHPDSSNVPLSRVSICPPEEARRLESWSRGRELAQPWTSLWGRFDSLATRFPHHVCLCGANSATYGELRALAERIAAALCASRTRGCVALQLERGPNLVAAMLAAWRCGRGVLPLSGLQPAFRRRYMVERAQASVLVVEEQAAALELLGEGGAETSVVILGELEVEADVPAPLPMPDEAPALVLFTSGSSGRPKGVVTSAKTLLNRLQWVGEAVPFEADELACAKADMGFIDATTELFGPLLHGVPVAVLPDSDIPRMDRLATFLEREGITRLVSVPSALRILVALARSGRASFDGIRVLVSSGEPLYGPLLGELREAFANARIHNFYGSTECAGEATWYETRPEDATRSRVPLGVPVAGTKVTVRDEKGRELPWGLTGEIVVEGRAVALGYLDEKGAVRPFSPQEAATLPTGDLGAWSADGQLIGLGRKDGLLKIRGQRLDPREVERLLQELPGVDEACVFALGGNDVLCACVTGEKELDERSLKFGLAHRLPPAFIPSLFLYRSSLPTTASGKRDLEALKELAKARLGETNWESVPDSEAGTDALADTVGRLWHKLVGKHPAPRSHFFLEGGHSLLAVRLAMAVSEELGVECEARDVFVHPLFESLVLCLRERVNVGESVDGEDGEWEEV